MPRTEQRNISAKNIRRIQDLESIEGESFQQLRSLVLEIAIARPQKRRRRKIIPERHPALFNRLVESGLFDPLFPESDNDIDASEDDFADDTPFG